MFSFRVLSEDGDVLQRRKELENGMGKLPSVEFLISCTTGTTTNNKKASPEMERVIRKGIAFFIIGKNESVEDDIKKILLDNDCEVEMTYIKPRNKDRESTEYAMDALTKVVKVSQNYNVFACYILVLVQIKYDV